MKEKKGSSKVKIAEYQIEHFQYYSDYLDRLVTLETYFPGNIQELKTVSILIINDGQDLSRMPFKPILNELHDNQEIEPILAVGIHCNADRRLEYGTADLLDYLNRGSRAKFHRKFIINELLKFVEEKYAIRSVESIGLAGFSLGGLSALDIAWRHPEIFSKVGVFSGSFWWRSKPLGNDYNDETDRIMHQLVRSGTFTKGQRFFFQTGCNDETADRNNNGIIDSIDDTLDVIKELEQKGYKQPGDIHYLELADGNHDVPTWARAFPNFLKWAFPRKA